MGRKVNGKDCPLTQITGAAPVHSILLARSRG